MPRTALPNAPRNKMRCAAYDKGRARQNARAVEKCTRHGTFLVKPPRVRHCPFSHYVGPLLSSQATCKHHTSHWCAGRETHRSRPAAFARPHATHLFFPCANAAYEQTCILACCWRGFHFTGSSPTRKPASTAWPPPLTPITRRLLVAGEYSHERLRIVAHVCRPCKSRIALAPPITQLCNASRV